LCRSEAPVLEQFAQDNADSVTVVGIGAQDDLAFAERFVSQTGTTFPMLWSDSNESWRHFGVSRNSSVLLLDSGGNLVDDNPGRLDPSDLSDRLSALT
jgi:thiol-disulfide isomerase/thioredoxin